MTVKSHIILSYIPLVVAVKKHLLPFDMEFLTIAIIGIFIGAILPDIDEPNSYIGRRLKFVSKMLKLFKIKHRTFTHSLFFPLLISLLGVFHPIFYFIAFGSFMHIIEDFLTNGGVPILYPIIKKRFSAYLFKTGSIWEFLFLGVITFLVFGYVLYY